MLYRPDIDGLRAIAVAAILVFHVQETLLPGGFLGVDLFFVISGYLITSLIAPEIAEDRFSFAAFYWRRAKRILPALYLVIAATLAAGAVLMLPQDVEQLARSAFYALISLANYFFYSRIDTGYFADETAELPLLHLWSLGVEEQFYLVWPLVLTLLMRHVGGALTVVCLALIAASFGLGEYLLSRDPSFAFYMMPTRAGELLAGAVLALNREAVASIFARRYVAEWASAIGLLLVLGSIALAEPAAGFPGVKALPITLGAVLIIAAGVGATQPLVSRLLSLPPFVGLGLISYSAYLWHWPILAFLRYFEPEISVSVGMAALGATLVLATLTYLLVERPFRSLKLEAGAGLVRLVAVPVPIGLALCLAIKHFDLAGLAVSAADAARIAEAERLVAHPASHGFNCLVPRFDPKLISDPRCAVGSGERESALLWGDSHAGYYVGFLDEMGTARGFKARNLSHYICPPLLANGDRFGQRDTASCARFNAAVAKRIADYPTVILGASWSTYDAKPGFRDELLRTIDALLGQGKTVVLLGRAPRFPRYRRECEARRVKMGSIDCRSRGVSTEREPAIETYLKRLATEKPGVSYVSVRDQICRKNRCSAYFDGEPIYFDSTHLSVDGARRLAKALVASGRVPAVFDRLGAEGRAATR